MRLELKQDKGENIVCNQSNHDVNVRDTIDTEHKQTNNTTDGQSKY